MDNSSKNLPNSNVRGQSSGGVVYRRNHDSIDIVGCVRHHPHVCALPKGTPYKTENIEQTALREVQEETGIVAEIVDYIDSIKYSYIDQFTEKRFYKTVYFYLMRPVGGDISFHDDEFDIVKWMSSKQALEFLKFEHERGILEKGLSMES